MTFHTWGNSIWNSKEVMRLTSRGRLGINTTPPTELLDVNGNIKCTGTFTNGSSSYMYAGGLRLGGYDPDNTIYNVGKNIGITVDNGYKINFTIWSGVSNTKMTINAAGVGIYNTSPWAPLCIGDCSLANSNGYINFGKRDNVGSFRNFKIGMNDFFVFCIGDNGNANDNTSTWNPQVGVWYNAPYASLSIGPTGKVVMQYDYGTSSDERIKTNIKTIENALDKLYYYVVFNIMILE